MGLCVVRDGVGATGRRQVTKENPVRTGLQVFVLRPTDINRPGQTDCTNGGVTMRYDRFTLTGEGVEGPFAPDARAPELRLVRRPGIGRHGATYLHAVPVFGPDGAPPPSDAQEVATGVEGDPVRGGMMGGNFITTCDSRFPSDYPIPVHDRFEDWRRDL